MARCEFRDFEGDVRIEASGKRCEAADRSIGETGGKFNSRLELTVRTSETATYKVGSPDTVVSVGDPWP